MLEDTLNKLTSIDLQQHYNVISITGASIYISGGRGVFNWLLFIPPAGVESPNYILWAIIASAVSAIVGFAIEFATYRPEKVRAAA